MTMDDEDITTEEHLIHEFWKFAETMLDFLQSDAWEGWKPKKASDVVDTLKGLFNDIKADKDSTYRGTGGFYVERESPDEPDLFHFGFEVTGRYFEYPFKDATDRTSKQL